MGWEWEVEVWVKLDADLPYEWLVLYHGTSARKARRAARQAYREGIGCIRTTWRPS